MICTPISNRNNFGNKIVNSIFGVALLLVALVLYLTYTLDQQYKENARWVIHTHQVLRESEHLFSLVKDAQRGQRGYVITGDSAYLEPYVTAQEAITGCLRTLQRLTIDQPTQQRRLVRLSNLTRQAINTWNQTLRLYNDRGMAVAIGNVKTGKGQAAIEAINGEIVAFRQYEENLLAGRQLRFTRSQQNLTFIQLTGGAVSLLLLVFSFGLLRSWVKREQRLSQSLDEQVSQRTQALQQANQELVASEEELRVSGEQLRRSLETIVDFNHRIAESEARFRTIANAAPVMIWMTDAEGQCEYLNQGWLDFTGRSLQAEQGEGWTEGVHPEERRAVLEAFRVALARREPVEVMFRLLRRDGQYRWVLDRGVPRFGGDGTLLGYTGSVLDITERQEAEQTLLMTVNQLENYQKALDKSALISITDRRGTIVHVNDLFCRVSGYEKGELIGQNHNIVNSGYHAKDFFGQLWRTIKAGQLWRGDVRNRAKDGSYYWVDTIINPIPDHRGKIVRYLSIRYEITGRKQAEQQLLEQNQQLQRVNERLDNTNQELDAANRELDHYVYRAGHDLRAPLVSVLGLINISRIEDDEAQKDLYLGLMEKSIHKLDAFIQDIIYHSRNARTDVLREQIEVRPWLEELVGALHYMQPPSLETAIDVVEEAQFYSDRKRISIIISNLLSNAYRYADLRKNKSWVHLSIKVHPNEVLLMVQDNGIGIDEQHQPKIFEMFYRASESSKGSGLGLYIVKETVDTLGGTVEATSVPGKGTSFTVRLPNLAE